jgi:hypothetical protein
MKCCVWPRLCSRVFIWPVRTKRRFFFADGACGARCTVGREWEIEKRKSGMSIYSIIAMDNHDCDQYPS